MAANRKQILSLRLGIMLFFLAESTIRAIEDLHKENIIRALGFYCPEQFNFSEKNAYSFMDGMKTEGASCCSERFNPENLDVAQPVSEYQTCMFPTNTPPMLEQDIISYNIVVHPPRNGCLSTTTNATTSSPLSPFNTINRNVENTKHVEVIPSCENMNESSKGFHPAFSKSTQLVYESVACALCHGVQDAVPWNAYAICPHEYAWLSFDKCNVHFYPFSETNTNHLQCFVDRFSKCPGNASSVISANSVLNISANDIIAACKMEGLPSFANVFYARNVFCYLCMPRRPTFPIKKCIKPTFNSLKAGVIPFIKIVDMSSFNTIHELEPTLPGEKNVCDRYKEQCSPILCPLGQVRSRPGHGSVCQFESVLWQFKSFALLLKVTFDEEIPTSHSFWNDLLSRDQLTSPWQHPWKLFNLYRPYTSDFRFNDSSMEVNSTLERSNEVYIELVYDQPQVNPTFIIQQFAETLDKHWTMQFNGSTIKGRQSLSKSTFESFTFIENSVTVWYFCPSWLMSAIMSYSKNKSENVFQSKYTIYKHTKIQHILMSGKIFLTKLFLRQLVEWKESEFDVQYLYSEAVAFVHKRTRKVFFDLQFQRMNDNDDIRTVRICLEDADFIYTESISTNRGHGYSYHLTECFVVVLMQVLLYTKRICSL